ncbi:hypothetical protein NHQ30_005129 [Ciborinia camelliae]|nr:hypothetical protein NHQ30_005129 [Ciborinia camelliae]
MSCEQRIDYLAQILPAWNTSISGKRPGHARSGCDKTDSGTNVHKRDDRSHGQGTWQIANRLLKNCHEWIAGGGLENFVNVSKTKQCCKEHAKAQCAIEKNTKNYSARNIERGFTDLLGHLQ